MDDELGLFMDNPLELARIQVRRNLSKGSKCPCCGKKVKSYTRKITKNMVEALQIISEYTHKYGGNYFHVERTFRDIGVKKALRSDFHKLRFWGLINKSEETGYYRSTVLGDSFLKGEQTVAKSIVIYNNKFLKYSDKQQLTIKDIMK